jgi:hypothetical protein
MPKNVFRALAPLLVIAAFAVIPAASQGACVAPACPHLYKNGVIFPQVVKARQIWWGTPKLTAEKGAGECRTAWVVAEENPVGGGAAKGKVLAVSPFECTSAQCTGAGGTAYFQTTAKLPWVTEAIENTPGVFREKVGHKGPVENKKPAETEPEFMDFTAHCVNVVPPEVEFFGEQDLLIRDNGVSVGAAPSQIEFQPEKVNPESHNIESELVGKSEMESTLKLMGYAGQELIEVHNP